MLELRSGVSDGIPGPGPGAKDPPPRTQGREEFWSTHHAQDGVSGERFLADDLDLEPADSDLVQAAAVLQSLVIHWVTLVLNHL